MEENQQQKVHTPIKVEVPLNIICLRRTAELFNNLANDFLELSQPAKKVAEVVKTPPPDVGKALAATKATLEKEMTAAKVRFEASLPTIESQVPAPGTAAAPVSDAPPPDDTKQVAPPPEDLAVAPPPPPDGPELADGIPWDVRIHAGSKAKYAKPPHGWKLKRRVAPDLVIQVEAELRQAMAATGAPIDPPAIIAVAPTGEITSFPTLITRVAKRDPKLSKEELDGFAQAVGLQKWEQIANRPDLIPKIAELLFPS